MGGALRDDTKNGCVADYFAYGYPWGMGTDGTHM